MKATLARILVRLYSQEWRSRYEKEFMEFLSETPVSLATIYDVAVSGIRESMTRRLRRRADAFRGIVLGKRRSLAQISGMLLGIAAFSLVAEASPRWTLHRPLEDFRIWSGDTRIRYEPGTENLAAAVSAVLPAVLASAEFTQSGINLHQPLLIYVCASERYAHALRRSGRLNTIQGRTEIFIAPSLEDPRRSAVSTLIAQWRDRCADDRSTMTCTR